jgi:hypothetical protein
VTAFLFLVSVVLGIVLGYHFVVKRAKKTYFANAEYWVYLPGEAMPSQDEAMGRMMNENPYRIRGQSPICQREGLVFSDVRLHIGFVKRTRNPHVFRPDLFAEAELPSKSALEILTEANSFVKLRYTSEDPLSDKRHLRFLVHAADAYAALGGAKLVYDAVTERLIEIEEWNRLVAGDPDATSSNLHVRIRWVPTHDGNNAETRGLVKLGMDELTAINVRTDERLLVTQVLTDAIATFWKDAQLPEALEVPGDLDTFRLTFHPLGDRRTEARILRLQAI